MSQAYIQGFARYIPEKKITNHELSKTLDTSDEWIYSHTGIRSRYIVADGQATSDLAIQAGKKAIANAQLTNTDIDLVIVSTSSPDYPGGIPSTACIVQHALGLEQAGAFDIANACSGFVYGLEVARNFVCAGTAQNILFICSEVYSSIVDWTDRSTCVLFGDGAAAVVVSAEHAAGACAGEISPAILGSDGNYARALMREAGGSRIPLNSPDYTRQAAYLFMHGRRVFNFAVRIIPQVIAEILDLEQLTLSDIVAIVPHQANQRLLESACRNKNIPVDLFFSNIAKYANTASASIPIALSNMAEQDKLQQGNIIIALSFGAGFSYGANVIRF